MDLTKMEPEDDPSGLVAYDYTHRMEDNKVSSEEANLSHLEVTGVKIEFVDHSYDIKSEIKVEDTTPVHSSFPMVNSEVDEDLFDVDRALQEQKVEISSEEDEVLTESIVDNVEKNVSQENTGIDRVEDKLTKCGSHKSDGSNIMDISRNSINHGFDTPQSLKLPLNRNTVKRPFKCDVCGKGFFKLTYRNRHSALHEGRTPFNCDVCGKFFRGTWDLNRHTRIHKGERPFKCEVCGMCCSELGNLKKHLRVHTGERPFKCDVCGKCFSQRSELNRHVHVHTGKWPFKCELCGKVFPRASELTRHARVHTDERPFKCVFCGKRFKRLENLEEHVHIHKSKKPFKCNVCDKSFTYSSLLNRHARIHTGERPFKCEFCGQSFSESTLLKRDDRIQTGERPFKCDACGKCSLVSWNSNS